MGTRIVLEKPDDELRPVGAAIVLETRLCQRPRWRACDPNGKQGRSENRDVPTIHVSPPDGFSIDEMGANDMPPSHFPVARTTEKIIPMSEAPARHLSLAGASNFRDLGGYPARDGRIV